MFTLAQLRIRSILLVPALVCLAPVVPATAAVDRQPDFDNDGYADLAMPVSGEKIGGAKAAGAVNVIYGTADKLKAQGDQFWHQNSTGIAESVNKDDWFGYSVAWGDFNADGYADLVVGAPGENNGAGCVHVIPGTIDGLSATGSQIWKQGADGVDGNGSAEEEFGHALAVGDFDGDGVDDLAISVPYQKVGGDDYAGAVHVLFGAAGSGLSANGDQYWSQDSDGLTTAAAEFYDGFGMALAAGDFNNDGRDDLAIGVPYENFYALNCGAVNVLQGSADGLTATGNLFLTQNTLGLLDSEEEDDYFGWALAAGDFDGDGRDDLAIGSEGETYSGKQYAGCVHVIHGSAGGLNTYDSQLWTQNSTGIAESAQKYDSFGSTLAAGDFNNDGRDDLAVAAMYESVGSAKSAGAVHILFGTSPTGLSSAGSTLLSQNAASIADKANDYDFFGSRLMIGDFNGDGRDDLAIGVPNENIAGKTDAGVMHVLYSSDAGTGPDGVGDQLWHQNVDGIEDSCENDDNCGW